MVLNGERRAGTQVHPGHFFDILAQDCGISLHVAVTCRVIDQTLVSEPEISTLNAVYHTGQRNHPVISTGHLSHGSNGQYCSHQECKKMFHYFEFWILQCRKINENMTF